MPANNGVKERPCCPSFGVKRFTCFLFLTVVTVLTLLLSSTHFPQLGVYSSFIVSTLRNGSANTFNPRPPPYYIRPNTLYVSPTPLRNGSSNTFNPRPPPHYIRPNNLYVSATLQNESSTTINPRPPPYYIRPNNLYVSAKCMGRLGNQMFQYASLLGIAHTNNRLENAFFPNKTLLSTVFQASHLSVRSSSGFTAVREKGSGCYDRKFETLPTKNATVFGFLQSWKYFRHIEDVIRREFTFQPHVTKEAQGLLRNLTQGRLSNVTKKAQEQLRNLTQERLSDVTKKEQEQLRNLTQERLSNVTKKTQEQLRNLTQERLSNVTQVVGIHVRRGDYVQLKVGQFKPPPPSFFKKATEYFRRKYHDVVFLVVSQDHAWCRRHLTMHGVMIVPPSTAPVHMALLTLCDHIIVSLGSYGWWSGYLAEGEVVYYNNCVHPNITAKKGFVAADHFYPGWLGIGD